MKEYRHTKIATKLGKIWILLVVMVVESTAFSLSYPVEDVSPDSELVVELNGCIPFSKSQGCSYSSARGITFWVAHDLRQEVLIYLDKEPVLASRLAPSQRVQGGTRFKLNSLQESRLLTVRVGDRETSIPLSQEKRPEALKTARDLIRTGELNEGVKLVQQSLPSVDLDWQGTALRLLGQAQRRLGEKILAEESLDASIKADLAVGRVSGAVRTATVLAFLLMEEGNYAKARRILEQDFALMRADAQSHYNLHYFKGLLAYNTSSARLAIQHLNHAAQQAQRMGQISQQVYAEVLLAIQLQRLGRNADANRYLSRWIAQLPEGMSACDESYVKSNIGWSRLLLLESGMDVDDPTALLQEADALTKQHCSSSDRTNTLANLALARLHADDMDGAISYIEEARSLDNTQFRTRLWLLDIEGRIDSALGRTATALEAFSRLERLAAATLSSSARWRALIGKARTYAAASNVEQALDAYLEAEFLLAQYLPTIPLDQGREALLNAKAAATREHVGLLVQVGRHEEAFALARESRVRALQSLRFAERIEHLSPEARQQWERALTEYNELRTQVNAKAKNAWMYAADELAELERSNESNERVLRSIVDRAVRLLQEQDTSRLAELRQGELTVLAQDTEDGWLVFAHDGNELVVFENRCTGLKGDTLATCLFTPLAEKLRTVDALRVLSGGPVSDIDFHATLVDGIPLVQILPVYYALDLSSAEITPELRGRALLVADAGGNLEAARNEIDVVSASLERIEGWRPHLLKDQAADATTVREALHSSRLFHFAGHARFAGEYGWDSHLELAADTSLGVADIITLDSAPSLVVLSGCETARTHGSSFAQSMGLASAFLVAGSTDVIATSRPVLDTTAELLMTEFYRHWVATDDPRAALRSAQIKLMQSEPGSDWAAYRLVTR